MSDYFVFGDVDSRDYSGIYVFDKSVDNTPKRVYEVKNIAGRNGAFYVDQGRYEDVEHSYGVVALTKSAGSNFINALVSQVGYHRLSDSFNEDEFYLATLTNAVEAKVSKSTRDVNTFDITFTRKPQRFLKSGEIQRTIDGSVTNTQTKSGAVVSLESDGGDKVTSLVTQIEPVQSGSGDPSPTNVRPITGWTAANVVVAGSNNLLDQTLYAKQSYALNGISFNVNADGTITVTGTATAETVWVFIANVDAALQIGQTYYVSGCPEGGSATTYEMRFANGAGYNQYYSRGKNPLMITYGVAPSPYNHRIRCGIYVNKGITINETFKPMVSLTPLGYDDYVPYKGTTYPVSFGSAGTIYGGTVDVVTGVLTVKWAAARIGALAWSYNSTSKYFYTSSANKATGAFNLMSDIYATATIDDVSKMGDYHVKGSAGNNNIFITDSRYTTAADFKTANDQKYVYFELPSSAYSTYNLTAQQVELLTGQNHVWADTGDITITWGDDPNKLVNPTLYDSHPLLHVWGYGDIGIGGDTLSINNDEYGRTLLANRLSKSATSVSSYLDESAVLMLNSGDDVFVSAGSSVVFPLTFRGSASINITSATIANSSPYDIPMESSVSNFGNYVTVSVSLPQLDFIFNQTLQHLRSNIRVTINYTEAGVSKSSTAECQIHAQYSLTPLGRYRVALFYYDVAVDKFYNPSTAVMTIQPIYGVSTQRPFSDDADFYFDLDIGEAYKVEDGQTISVNNAVTIPAQLPTLKSGANTITYDDTITQFKVVPRWWEV